MKNPKARRRVAPSSVRIDANVRCQRIYPTEATRKNVDELKTIGFRLSGQQAIHLARVLLAVAQDWDDIDVTGYRLAPRKRDGTYQITVTSGL